MNPHDPLRKSTPTPAQHGNVRKADTYREAFTRIELAIEEGYFLEAIAILESIIADRLASYLAVVGCQLDDPRPALGDLLQWWRRCEGDRSYDLRRRTPQGLVTEQTYDDLAEAVDRWRLRVDEALHAFVASPRGVPTEPVESFLVGVRRDALEGRVLCDAVIGWHRRHARPGATAGAVEQEVEEIETAHGTEASSAEGQDIPPLSHDVPSEPPLGGGDPAAGQITDM